MSVQQELIAAFLTAHPADAARALEGAAEGASAALLIGVPPAAAAAVMRRMAPAAAAEVAGAMPGSAVAAIVAELPVDAAGLLLRRMGSAAQEAVLNALPQDRADPIRRLLRYPEGTAGALMDPRTFTLPDDITVREARARVQRGPRDLYYYLYIVDRTHALVGVLDIRELLLARPRDPVTTVMRAPVARLPARAELTEILSHPGWQRYDALPVVEEGTLVGVIRGRALQALVQDAGVRRHLPPAVSVALTLGELYWIGLLGLVRALAPAPGGRHPGG